MLKRGTTDMFSTSTFPSETRFNRFTCNSCVLSSPTIRLFAKPRFLITSICPERSLSHCSLGNKFRKSGVCNVSTSGLCASALAISVARVRFMHLFENYKDKQIQTFCINPFSFSFSFPRGLCPKWSLST